MKKAYPHLLLINSQSGDRALLRLLLDSLDVQVTEAASGLEAVDILQSEIVDIVVTDIEIGAFDGWRLARIIRSGIYQTKREIPIIVVTRIWCERITEITARDFGVNQLLGFDSRGQLPEMVDLCLKNPAFGLQKAHLLVVEDHIDNAELVKKILRNRFEIELAADGQAGLDTWKEKRHDLVLLDVMLPKLSGSAVLKEIMAIDPLQPVVIMTAHGTMEIARHLMLGGAADFVTKPFRPEELRWICELATRRDDYLVSNAQFAARVESLHQLRHLLGNVIDSMPSLLIGVDTQGIVILWNKEAEIASGVSAEEATGRLLDTVWPDFGHMKDVYRSLDERQITKLPKVLCYKTDKSHFCDITIYPLFDRKIVGAVIRMDDITERIHLEKRMIQSEKMVSMGRLAAGLAHEINNPLAGIMQNVQVIRNRLEKQTDANTKVAIETGLDLTALAEYIQKREIDSRLDAVMASGSRAAKLIENMLSFSHKDGSAMVRQSLAKLLDKSVELATSNFNLKKKFDFRIISIHRDYTSDLPEIGCNASQIQQVFFNLLLYGAAAMEEKRRTLQEDQTQPDYLPGFTLRIKDEVDSVRVEIEDNGPGMDAESEKHIFDPFFTPAMEGEEPGLGLSICYFIICENHRGSITVKSVTGSGTKFQINLPKNL